MGDNIRNYLESWRSRYSYPNYIGDNQFLTSDGKLVEDTPNGYSAAQKTLVEGSAIGTASNYYLDPHPLFNRLGEIYSNILGSQAYSGARTDSIKMNRLNMDYTNGRVLRDLEKPQLECFKFISSNQSVSIYDARNGNALNNLLNLVLAFKDRNPKSEIIEINVREVTPNERDRIKYYNTLVQNTLTQFNNVLKEEKLDANPGNSTNNNKYFLKIKIIDSTDEASYERLYIIPSQNYYKAYTTYKNRRVAEHSGLQLLMPRYARRVEVEDLDENFWVIGQILDAVVKALWGPYGLIDVVRQIIYEVNKDKREDNVNDIKLLHDGSDDLYFDMYSRFTMNDLQLKLITDSGERIIKDIFKPHTNKSDRKINGKDTTTNGETSVPALFEEITEEMYGETYANDTNTDGTNNLKDNVLLYGEGNKNFTGLFDSDLARSEGKITVANKDLYVSLSTVIDAINDKVVTDSEHILKGYSYIKDPKSAEFFTRIDPTNGDGQLSPKDLEKIIKDIKEIGKNTIVNRDLLSRLKAYEESYKYLEGLKSLEDFPLFIREQNPKPTKEELDAQGLTEEAWIEKKKNEILAKYYKEVNCEVPYVYLNDISENNTEIIDRINEDLDTIYSEVETMYELNKPTDSTGSSTSVVYSSNIAGNTVEMINKLYEKYTDLISMGDTDIIKDKNGKNKPVYKFDISSNEGDLKYFKNGLEGLSSTIAQIVATQKIEFNTDDQSSDIRIILGIKDFMTETTYETSSTSYISANWELKNRTQCADAMQEFIDLIQNLCISINTSTQISKSSIEVKITNASGGETIKTVDHKFSSRLAAEVLIKSVEGQISILIDNNSSTQYTREKNKFIPYHLTTFSPITKDKIPIYSANVAAEIANDIARPINIREITMGKYVFASGIGDYKADQDVIKAFFDILDDNKVNVRDAAKISNYGLTLGDKAYWKKTTALENLIDICSQGTPQVVREFKFSTRTYQLSAFFDLIFNKKTGKFYDTNLKKSDYEKLKRYIFTYIDNPLLNTTCTIKFHVPTSDFLLLLTKDNSFYKEGVDWSGITNDEICSFADKQEFRICDNMLIYLFDPDYYNLRYVKSVGSKHYPSLYINATDIYFNDITNPIIPGNIFTGNNIPLFVPHNSLKNGEIIEIQIDGTSYSSTSNLHSHFDFKTAVEYANGENFVPALKDGRDEKRMNLVLHNSFANRLQQYNYRTTYFIKETDPLYSLSDKTNQIKTVSDFFNRGIKVTYFRPQRITQNIENKTQSITTAQTIRKQLKIYASMIASKYQYIDNSYVLHSDIGDALDKVNISDEGTPHYSGKCAPKDCYVFNSRQAYCGAVRNNLIFYSTAGTNEYGQFIHSPLLALESPNKFSPSQTIQTPLTTSRGIIDSKGTPVTPTYYSVVEKRDQSFSINGLKDMLYRDGYENKVTPVIDIAWGRRQVSNYIKKKSLDYIVIERELGERHIVFAPTYAQIISADQFFHGRENLSAKSIRAHKVEWYGKNGNKFEKLDYNGNYSPEAAVYGVIKLEDLKLEQKYGGNYIVRFFNISPTSNVDDKIDASLNISGANFTITDGTDTIVRRPIIKRVYFLGTSFSGKRNHISDDNKD